MRRSMAVVASFLALLVTSQPADAVESTAFLEIGEGRAPAVAVPGKLSSTRGLSVRTPSALANGRGGEWITFSLFFQHMAHLEDIAAEREALGQINEASAWRTLEQRQMGLSETEDEVLRQVSSETNGAVRGLLQRQTGSGSASRQNAIGTTHTVRAAIGASGPQLSPKEIEGRFLEREAIVKLYVEELRARLGEATFERLRRQVYARFRADAIDEVRSEGLAERKPEASGPYVSVSSHLTVGPSYQAFAECFMSPDAATAVQYPAAEQLCSLYDEDSGAELARKAMTVTQGLPIFARTDTITVPPGRRYKAEAVHALNGWVGACGLLDPFGYFIDGSTPPEQWPCVLEEGLISPSGVWTCWGLAPYLPDIGISQSYIVTVPDIRISPLGREVLPGQSLTFSGSILPASYSQELRYSVVPIGLGEIGETSGVFTAPQNDALDSSVTFTVTACSTVLPEACASTQVSVPKVTIEVEGTEPLFVPDAMKPTRNLTAIVRGPSSYYPEVVYAAPEAGKGTLEQTQRTAVYTAPASISAVTPVTIKVSLKDIVPEIATNAVLKLIPPVKIGSIATTPDGGWVAGATIGVAINGSGFGENPIVSVSPSGILFSKKPSTETMIPGTAVIPLMKDKTLVTVTVSSTTDGVTPPPATKVLEVRGPTAKATIAPKFGVSVPAYGTKLFSVSASCITAALGGATPCPGSWAATWSTLPGKGTIAGGGESALYTAPSAVTTDSVGVCAFWNPEVFACDTASVSVTPPPPPTVTGISPNSGPMAGGTSVQITGTNFRPGAAVAIATNVTVVSPTLIRAKTLANACGARNVVVAQDGVGGSLVNRFTFTNPQPTHGLSPNGVSLSPRTVVSLSWAAMPGATQYNVSTKDLTTGTTKVALGWASNTMNLKVVPGHSYSWGVQAGSVCGYFSDWANGSFSVRTVIAEPVYLLPPTGLAKEPSPSMNLFWTPPYNVKPEDQVSYKLWLKGGNGSCVSGCWIYPSAPSWYTMGSSVGSGGFTWTLQAISASRDYSSAVTGPSFTLP